MQPFEKQREQTLLRFLDQLNTREAVLSYPQIHGLLYAMACSPEPIKPAEWFELVWLNDDPQFDDAADAQRFYHLLIDLFESIRSDVRQGRVRFHSGEHVEPDMDWLIDWSDGFLLGHQYLDEVWHRALDELDDDEPFEQVEDALACAIAFASGAIADASDDSDILQAEFVRFQQVLEDYRSIHKRCEPGQSRWSVEQIFAEMEPVAPEFECPCGSGRLFRQCCLH